MNGLLVLRRELSAFSNDAGITFIETYQEATNKRLYNDKLLLVYFCDSHCADGDNFFDILMNSDVNDLLKSDFIIHVSSHDNVELEFLNIIQEPGELLNTLFVFHIEIDDMSLVTRINVLETSQKEIMVELFQIHCSFQESLMKANDREVENCARDYLTCALWTDEYKYLPLENALDVAMNQPVHHLRKMLMIYMYKEGSALTQQFNYFLECGVLKKYNAILIPVFWNVSHERYHKALKIACQRYFEQEILEETVASEEGGVFFFVPDEKSVNSTPRIFTKITSSDTYMEKSSLVDALDYLFTNFQETNEITDLHEIDAIDAYLGGNTRLLAPFIQTRSLHDIIEECCESPRKLLLLYFHVPGSKLERLVPRIKSLFVREQMIFLPWDVTDAKRNRSLVVSLQRAFGMKKVEMILNARKSALFMFLPIGQTLVLHSVLEDKAGKSDIEKAYRNAHKFFQLESMLGEDEATNFGPAAYQQVLCDQLGDRDFDCFQLDKDEGEQLRSKIAFAYFGPPPNEDGEYEKDQKEQIEKTFNKVVEEAKKLGDNDQKLYVSFMRVCVTPLPAAKRKKLEKDKEYQPLLDFNALPLFAIRKCFDCPADKTPCRIFVDHSGRTYDTWEDFLENNKYPAVMLIAPKNGKYSCDCRGKVRLEICPSPECGIGVAVLKGFDIGASVVGGVAAGVGVAAAFVSLPFLPIVLTGSFVTGAGVGVYGIVRSGMVIADRVKYKQSMSIREAEARGAYFNIIAGSLGFTAAGATFALAYAAKSGVNVGLAARAVVNGITIANVAAGGAAVGNSAYDVIVQWTEDGRPNALALVQLSSSILFFGHAVYSTQMAGTIVRNAQARTISDVLDSLSSNRQRKTMLRLLDATIERAGSAATGNAEVIRYVQNLDNVQEVIGVLTRDTKLMSRNGVRYTVDNGQIVFNGVEMNVQEFGNLSKVQRVETLSAIPTDAAVSKRVASPVKAAKSNTFTLENAFRAYQTAAPIIQKMFDPEAGVLDKINVILARFQPYIQRELILIMGKIMEKMGFAANDLFRSLTDLYPGSQFGVRMMDLLVQFYWNAVADKLPREWRDKIDLAVNMIEKAVIVSTFSMAHLVANVIEFLSKWTVREILRRSTDPALQAAPASRATKRCDRCNGKFYTT